MFPAPIGHITLWGDRYRSDWMTWSYHMQARICSLFMNTRPHVLFSSDVHVLTRLCPLSYFVHGHLIIVILIMLFSKFVQAFCLAFVYNVQVTYCAQRSNKRGLLNYNYKELITATKHPRASVSHIHFHAHLVIYYPSLKDSSWVQIKISLTTQRSLLKRSYKSTTIFCIVFKLYLNRHTPFTMWSLSCWNTPDIDLNKYPRFEQGCPQGGHRAIIINQLECPVLFT